MIAGFADNAKETLFHFRRPPRRFPPDLVPAALRKLDMLNAATSLLELRSPPSNRLELLKGPPAGMHSIRVYDQWRLAFLWSDSEASQVQVVDYH